MERIQNCTPHPITVRTKDLERTFEPSGIVPRVETIETPMESLYGIPCVTQSIGVVVGLPQETCDMGCRDDDGNLNPFCADDCVGRIFLIVSQMVFSASDRKDLIAPDTGKGAIRDPNGRILAVTRFIRK